MIYGKSASAVCRLPSAVCRLPSAVCPLLLPSALCRLLLPSSVCLLPLLSCAPMETYRIMIVAGEPSGDAHAAALVHALRKAEPQAQFEFFGATGPLLR